MKNMGSNIKLFADDTSIFIIVENPISAPQLPKSDVEKNRQMGIRLVS